jgi:tyrosyl-tRNA synthetase
MCKSFRLTIFEQMIVLIDHLVYCQGIVKTINVNKMVRAGCKVKIWIADWFAQLNNKMGGDLKKIQTVGRYMIEIWRAAGMNLDGVEFLWSSEEINNRANEYWPLVMDIACKNNVKRIMRCCQIMGRNDSDELTAAQIFYPCMQCADIFFLKVSKFMLLHTMPFEKYLESQCKESVCT